MVRIRVYFRSRTLDMNRILLFLLGAGLLATGIAAVPATASVESHPPGNELYSSDDARFVLGTGIGIVRFDVNAKVTDKDRDASWFVDLEGNLDLDEVSEVRNLYAAYQFTAKHSMQFSYFDIDRRSTLLNIDENFEDLLLIRANLEVRDRSRFYNLSYGYTLHGDDHNKITLLAGLNILNLKLEAEARGSITLNDETVSAVEIVDEGVHAPLPLIGLSFNTRFTPEWSLSTQVSYVGGSYQDVTASVLQTQILSRYQFSRHVGFLLGLTYFSANAEEDDSDELLEVSYQYNGVFLGLHVGI